MRRRRRKKCRENILEMMCDWSVEKKIWHSHAFENFRWATSNGKIRWDDAAIVQHWRHLSLNLSLFLFFSCLLSNHVSSIREKYFAPSICYGSTVFTIHFQNKLDAKIPNFSNRYFNRYVPIAFFSFHFNDSMSTKEK